MSKYKVGDKVWLIEENKYGIIEKVYGEDTYIIDGEGYVVCELHEIADTMLKRLGLEKVLKDNSCIIYNKHFYGEGFITEIKFDKVKMQYKLTNYTNNNYMFAGWIEYSLHEALTQLMRELEANEN